MVTSPHVVALSIGAPKWEEVRGRPVLTSIVREASPGPFYFGVDGLAGNSTAVHTEQVLAFCDEHYDHWAETLGIPREAWGPCHWGENITLTGFDENDLRIGDILEVGPEARFEVIGPRNPCFKLAWRIGQPDAVLRPMVERGFIGFYLSVITPGSVARGDPIVHRRVNPEAVTLGDLGRLIAGIGEVSIEEMRRIVALPALGGQARGMVAKLLTAAEDKARLKIGRWRGWRAFEIAETTHEADEVRSFTLVPVDGQPVAPYRAGQFLTVRLSPSESGDAISRVWSLSDYQDMPESYRVTIKRAVEGLGSAWMHDVGIAGQRVLVRPPAGRFTIDRGGFKRAVLVSAGIGITPMLAMLRAHALRGTEAPPLLWLHVTRNGRSHIRRRETDRILRQNGFERWIFYTDPLPEDVAGVDYDEAGRLTAERLGALLSPDYRIAPFGREIAMQGAHSEVYLCGPTGFELAMREALLALGVAEEQIHSESFGTATGARAGPAVQAAGVTFAPEGAALDWTAEDDMTLLELAEQHGIDAPFVCRLGQCGSCEAALVSGEVVYDPQPTVAPPPGRVLLCCARPASAHVALNL